MGTTPTYRAALLLAALLLCAAPLNGQLLSTAPPGTAGPARISGDPVRKHLLISDSAGTLSLRVTYGERLGLDLIRLQGEELTPGNAGATTTATVAGVRQVPATRGISVHVDGSAGHISGIRYAADRIAEEWTFQPHANSITWRIQRTVGALPLVDEWYAPEFIFPSVHDWTGALLGTGGVAWFRLFDSTGATYGVHTNTVLLWKSGRSSALRITAQSLSGDSVAVRISRLPGDRLSIGFSVTARPLRYRHDEGTHRRRYLPARTDVWMPFIPRKGEYAVRVKLETVAFDELFGIGTIKGLDRTSLESFCHTVSRIGVIDAGLHGSNSWRTPYGPVALHEPYIAQLGLITQDANYWRAYQRTLENFRDHALQPEGRVKSRWAYTCEDAIPGTCDSLGFYEAQWGILLDSNPDYVTNVAELFDFTADLSWLRDQKRACERALDFLLARDSDGDGLVEMMTDDHAAARGSDWLDIIWASHENAFVNAKLHLALTLWARCEGLLGDRQQASKYAASAARLKASFNLPTSEGGLWDPGNGWYVHWRDRDGSVHGNNLATFVNFQAIAYGVCDDPARRASILGRIEAQMRQENLFFWPVCMFSYAPGEGLHWQWPFPKYENGEIFLSLGEVGTRAYAGYDPAIALRYVKNLIEQYNRDGLAFQRYERTTRQGAGDDILAGNALGIVGLFRHIYGIQPKFNRLLLDPHPTPELHGTRLTYRMRGRKFIVGLDSSAHFLRSGRTTVSGRMPFGLDIGSSHSTIYAGTSDIPSLRLPASREVTVDLESWSDSLMIWSTVTRAGMLRCTVTGRTPGSSYRLEIDGQSPVIVTASKEGKIGVEVRGSGTPRRVRLTGIATGG